MSRPPATDLPELLRGWAGRPTAWRPGVRHDPADRTYALLHRDDEVEVYVVCWMSGHDTGFHDHDESVASIMVIEGSVREERLALGDPVGTVVTAGEVIEVPSDAIHRVRHAGRTPAITLHAYCPPLARVGAYHLTAEGTLVRRSRDADIALEAAA